MFDFQRKDDNYKATCGQCCVVVNNIADTIHVHFIHYNQAGKMPWSTFLSLQQYRNHAGIQPPLVHYSYDNHSLFV